MVFQVQQWNNNPPVEIVSFWEKKKVLILKGKLEPAVNSWVTGISESRNKVRESGSFFCWYFFLKAPSETVVLTGGRGFRLFSFIQYGSSRCFSRSSSFRRFLFISIGWIAFLKITTDGSTVSYPVKISCGSTCTRRKRPTRGGIPPKIRQLQIFNKYF